MQYGEMDGVPLGTGYSIRGYKLFTTGSHPAIYNLKQVNVALWWIKHQQLQ